MKFTLLFFVLGLHAMSANCQHAMIIHGGKPIRFTIHSGYIINSNQKLIFGNFLYDENEFPTYNLKTFNSIGKKSGSIKIKDIKKVVLYGHDITWNQSDSTFFYRFPGKTRLFRRLTESRIRLYDDLFSVDENPGRFGTSFYLASGNQLEYCNSYNDLIKKINDIDATIKLNSSDSLPHIIKKLTEY